MSSSYALGVLFLVIVSVLWTACSMVVQHLYNDMSFDSPFLIVYIGTSLFSVFLPSRLGYERWGHRCLVRLGRWWRRRRRSRRAGQVEYCDGDQEDEGEEEEEDAAVVIPWRDNRRGGGGEGEIAVLVPSSSSSSSTVENDVNGRRAFEVSSDGAEDDDRRGREPPAPPPSDDGNDDDVDDAPPPPLLLSHLDHLSMASRVAPLWFLSNYSYAVSLRWTSIASSTVLASMGSVFAFAFATCTRYGDERATGWKVAGVALCFAGGVATAWTDAAGASSDGVVGGESDGGDGDGVRGTGGNDDPSARSLLGDLAGLLSAVGYGAYTVLLRHVCPKDEDRMSMQLLFGYVGLLNMISLFPVAVWLVASSRSSGDGISPSQEDLPPEDGADDGLAATTTTTLLLLWVVAGTDTL
jgi:solute carrier family 35 protein F5